MFNFFKKDIYTVSISNIETRIKDSNSFKHFTKDNSNQLLQYKDFEITIVSSAFYFNLLSKTVNDSNSKTFNEDIKKIYFSRTSSFLRNQILSGKLFWDFLSTGHIPNEALIMMHVFAKFNKYTQQINSALQDNSPYWLEEFENSEYDEELGIGFSGQKHYYPFISNVLLSEIKESDNSQRYVNTKELWELEDLDNEKFNLFVEELNLIKKIAL